jgi:hypothetical protein
LVNLIERSSKKVAKAIASTPRWRNARRTAHTQALERVSEEATELRRTLLKTYAGERLRKALNWALSSGGDDDVSSYLSLLTEMEQRLFHQGAAAQAAYEQWKLFGNRRLIAGVSQQPQKQKMTATPVQGGVSRAVTPGAGDEEHREKRRRVE